MPTRAALERAMFVLVLLAFVDTVVRAVASEHEPVLGLLTFEALVNVGLLVLACATFYQKRFAAA